MFLTRCKDTTKKNSLYYTSRIVRDIIMSNDDRLKIINTGVKAFTKCENKGATCDFRLAQEGIMIFLFQDIFLFCIKCFLKAHPNSLIFKKQKIPLKLYVLVCWNMEVRLRIFWFVSLIA